jgi:uncharacterized protein YggE
MLKKSLLFVLLAGLLLAGCNGTTTVVSAPSGYQTGLTVNGRGEISLAPDVAYVTIGVHTQASDVAAAVGQNADQVASVMAALADMGVAQEDMQTSNFSLYTGDEYDPSSGMLTGNKTYTVDNTVNVTVRDLANMGQLLDGAISAGANSIWGVTFDVDDKSAAADEARDLALEEAIAEAQALAEAAGVSLGDILTISYSDSGSYYYPPYYGMGGGGGAAMESAATSIVPGLITVSAEVVISYQISQ